MKRSIQSVVVLTVICIVISALLAAVNAVTFPIIEKAEAQKANEALLVVMPNGENFEELSVSEYELPSSVTNIYREANGGYVFKMTTTGYSSGLVVMCGIDGSGMMTGAVCLSSGETLGYEKTFGERFVGLYKGDAVGVDTISGATKTTSAYKNAVNDAFNAFIIMKGGSVDVRTEEEILADELSAALPNGKDFKKEFIVDVLDDIDAVYLAQNGAGYVFVSGESFVGIANNGAVVGKVDEVAAQKALDAYAIHKSSSLAEIDLSAYDGISDKITKAYKTSKGNYVFSLKASGYGINGEWHASGEYIMIDISVTSGGKVISCVTTSQNETENVGSVCASPSYYEQYNGKTLQTLDTVDTISGATFTHKGYSVAVLKALEAVNILEGAK